MIAFEEFVETLGNVPNNYTEEELHQLRQDVHAFAQIVLAIERKKLQTKMAELEAAVDGSCRSVTDALLLGAVGRHYTKGKTENKAG